MQQEPQPDLSKFEDGLCFHCRKEATQVSVYEMYWCDECALRAALLNYGFAHGWPELPYEIREVPYSISQGAYYWFLRATLGTEESVGLLLAYAEYRQEQA